MITYTSIQVLHHSTQHNGVQTIKVNLDVFITTGTQMPTKIEVTHCL
jgi:hypothetical protein